MDWILFINPTVLFKLVYETEKMCLFLGSDKKLFKSTIQLCFVIGALSSQDVCLKRYVTNLTKRLSYLS